MNEDLLECAFHQKAKRTRCVAYCENHKCYLTIVQLKSMKCLQKQCKHLTRIENHQFWIERAKRKRGKKTQ